ncbi:PepSY domain-containing protein [Alteromonas sp. 5E99-2]|uniref:PepSY-associated TM helix domain-containing protein n=1 Tax=Alteromonas sp. 5E99-2 TaxID=2817683 RepID=UPI001A99A65F|nr:PepSY-associated TM helix domain-containing protein [Alteromonas sp. 5E99-2]MBO1256895.1 PepSY domain-containing protein [Alteromonas sp. 5E99-2]
MSNKKSGLKKLYNWHAWVGFQLALLMFVVLATGTIATLSNEIDWLIFPELRSSEKPDDAPAAMGIEEWVATYQSIHSAYPDTEITSIVQLDSEYLSTRAVLKSDALHNRFVQIDPWTHEIKGDMPRLTVQRFFRDFHRYLFMSAFPGLLIVGPLSIVLLISIYTGLKTTRNWRKALWRIRFDQGKRILLSDLHKVMGLWGIWFSILMAVTGAWYFYEFGNAIAQSPIEPKGPKIEQLETEKPIIFSVDEFRKIVTKAYDTHENWEITALFMPTSNTAPIQLRGVSKNNPVIRNRALRVYIHPETFDVVEAWSPDTISTQAYINEYADPLHFGDFGGFWLKLLWFVFGIALTAMSFTGVLMTWKRTGMSTLTKVQKRTLPILLLSVVFFCFYVPNYL